MNSKTGPNGGQPLQSGKSATNNDKDAMTTTENVEKQKEFCRDFIWGACSKGTQCRFRHELDLEVMKKTLKFCHDFQNSTGCSREHCTYLHASKEEQSLFKATGQLPQVLAQRHANMSAAETIPQIALYIQESLGSAPPPPPPPPPSTSSASVPVSKGPPTGSVFPRPPVASVSPMVPRPLPGMPIQQPPPPPPPTTVPSTSVRQHPPIFTAPPPTPLQPPFAMTQPPPPMVPIYDASKPPPPIMKRKASNDDVQARPAKVKKGEDTKSADALCEQCIEKEHRLEALRKQLDSIYEEEEYETLMYKKKFDEYQNLKEILKSLISTDLFQKFVEDNVEGNQNQFHNLFGQSYSGGVSTVPNQFLCQLIEYIMTDSRNLDMTPAPSLRIDESLIHALSSLARKSNPVKIVYNANNNSTHNNSSTNNNSTNTNNSTNSTNSTNTPEVILQTFMDLLRQFNSSDRSPPSELNRDFNTSPSISNTSTNNSILSSNRQNDIPATVPSSRYPPPATQGVPPAPPVFAHVPANATVPYPNFQPMPPTALYYPPPFAAPPTGMQIPPDSAAMRPPVPLAMPPAPPPPAPLAPVAPPVPPVPTPMYPPGSYAIGRYPPPYYPRHQ